MNWKRERLRGWVSIGGVMCAMYESLDAVLRRADASLYRAKSGGRNRLCWMGELHDATGGSAAAG